MKASKGTQTRRAMDRLLARTEQRTDDALQILLTAGPDAFTDHLGALLSAAHTRAVYLGRYRAGDTAPPDDFDAAYADDVMREQTDYLARFRADLSAGRYRDADGRLDLPAVRRRALSYRSRVIATGTECWALVATGPFTWHLGADEGSCAACPRLAAGSPYAVPPTVPRAGDTECLFSCRCTLLAADGTTSF